jgi:hypothetical protein
VIDRRSEQLIPNVRFDSHPIQGYRIRYADTTAFTSWRHQFCGMNEIAGAQCPNCKRPLLLFLSLDAADDRLTLTSTGLTLLPLLFCWRCNVSQDLFYYRVFVDGSVSLIRYKSGGVTTDFPYKDYPDHFPGAPALLEPLTRDHQNTLRLLNTRRANMYRIQTSFPEMLAPQHQVGGEPLILRFDAMEPMLCIHCSGKMAFLACIADDCLDTRGLIGYQRAQVLFHFCRNCNVVGALNRAD